MVISLEDALKAPEPVINWQPVEEGMIASVGQHGLAHEVKLTVGDAESVSESGMARLNLRHIVEMSRGPLKFAYIDVHLPRVDQESVPTVFMGGRLVLDRVAQIFLLDEQRLDLTRKEFGLLAFLAVNRTRVFSREELLDRVWHSSDLWQGKGTVTEHVRRSRIAIGDDDRKEVLQTVRGKGYKFDDTAQNARAFGSI